MEPYATTSQSSEPRTTTALIGYLSLGRRSTGLPAYIAVPSALQESAAAHPLTYHRLASIARTMYRGEWHKDDLGLTPLHVQDWAKLGTWILMLVFRHAPDDKSRRGLLKSFIRMPTFFKLHDYAYPMWSQAGILGALQWSGAIAQYESILAEPEFYTVLGALQAALIEHGPRDPIAMRALRFSRGLPEPGWVSYAAASLQHGVCLPDLVINEPGGAYFDALGFYIAYTAFIDDKQLSFHNGHYTYWPRGHSYRNDRTRVVNAILDRVRLEPDCR